MLHKWLFFIGQRLRNPSLQSWFVFLKKSENWSFEELEAYQLKQLKKVVAFAYQHSKFYQKKLKEKNISPNDIQSLQAIKLLPIIEKKDLLTYNQEIHTYQFSKVRKATTSGSSGESLVFEREEQADSFNRAAIFRGYSWYKVQPWQRNGYFWGFNFTWTQKIKTQCLDVLQNRFRVFSYQKNEFESFVKKLKTATYIHGYSSMIYQTAKLINERKLLKPKHLKMVKGTSEKIFDKYQEEVVKAFELPIISEYGATESGIIAFECPYGNMHLNMEGVIVEEEANEIIVTNLQMRSFPIIRYKLGDYITLASKDTRCACGKSHRILKEVTGRVGANVHGKTQIFPSLYFYYIFKNIAKRKQLKWNYQVRQTEKGALTFYIEQSLTLEERKLLDKEITKYFEKDVEFTVKDQQQLQTANGKFKSFISTL